MPGRPFARRRWQGRSIGQGCIDSSCSHSVSLTRDAPLRRPVKCTKGGTAGAVVRQDVADYIAMNIQHTHAGSSVRTAGRKGRTYLYRV